MNEMLAQAGQAGSHAWEETMGQLMKDGSPVEVSMKAADEAQARAVLDSLGIVYTSEMEWGVLTDFHSTKWFASRKEAESYASIVSMGAHPRLYSRRVVHVNATEQDLWA